jgi:diadenosine tetraphosphatase ApaH/serine/threonine PP2A family protein phosphatase
VIIRTPWPNGKTTCNFLFVIFGSQIKEWLDKEIIRVKVDDDEGCECIGQQVLKVSS